MVGISARSVKASLLAFLICAPLLNSPSAEALFAEIPSQHWVHTYAGTASVTNQIPRVKNVSGIVKSKFKVTYSGFPEWAKQDVQSAIDIWSVNFSSTVPISIEATWGRSTSWGILGSARPGNFFSSFPGAPDPSLWYTSALANAIAGKDLDKSNPEMIIEVNSGGAWNSRGDGLPRSNEYDLTSVFLHEIAHGLGFISNESYETLLDIASLDQPTPFDAFAQSADGRRLADLPTPSAELAKTLTSSLVWSGPAGIKANGGVKPKLYTPLQYQSGSSTSHLDEQTFSKAGRDSLMTPNLDPGEIFTEPGPLLLAMLEDMRSKPPAGIATGLPDSPRNAKALIADAGALITFDPPANLRSAQISGYVIKNLKTGVESQVTSSPALVTGLKNGTSYAFTVTAKNLLGSSPPATTKPVVPQAGWKSSLFDAATSATNITSTLFNGLPAVAYTDGKSGRLKLALYNGKTWKKITMDGAGGSGGRTRNPITSPISMCVNGTNSRQTLHLFYSDETDKDLRYATYNGKTFTYDVVDGNGASVNSYQSVLRVRTASDVSVSNACIATINSVQVFYRDETQGILLGAIKTKNSAWNYELIDGDRDTEGRSIGDVGNHLSAMVEGTVTYLVYDAILSVNQKREITSGAVRVASRTSAVANSWSYQTLDVSTDKALVFGFDISLTKVNGHVRATWLASSASSFPEPNQLRWASLYQPQKISSITTENFGAPGPDLSSDANLIVFNCQERLCAADTTKTDKGQSAILLVTSNQSTNQIASAWVTINKVRYLLATVDNKLSLLTPRLG